VSVADDLKDLVRELVLLVFDRATSNVRKRIAPDAPTIVDRDDLEQAIIELRFEQMALVLHEADRQKREFPDEWRRLVDEAEEHARREREASEEHK